MLDGSPNLLTLPIRGLHKDLETVLSYTKEIRFPLIFAVVAEQLYLDGMASRLDERGPSALVELYERKHIISVRTGERRDE